MVANCLPQRQQIVSQPSSFQTIVDGTHTTITPSPVITLSTSTIESLTTSNAIVMSVSEQNISTAITTAGVSLYALHIVNQTSF